ncbi:hypothetical protein C1646_753313 [Rhizophagus diaphanus]|nr:hypothetical protein C1646_753313 [Rhizophagus diaphanus] [Rhizophagus sp. MUCL 43196]
MDEVLGNINYGEWLDKSEKLQDLTKWMLELIANYMMVVQLGKNAELEIVYLETSRPNSSQDKQVRNHKKLIRFFKDSIDTTRSILKLKKIFNQPSKRQNLSIFTINIAGDILELYVMQKESGIYKYCLIEETTIPLPITSPSAVYLFIHALMTLRMAIACTIRKILYSSNFWDSEHSSSEMVVMVMTPKNS